MMEPFLVPNSSMKRLLHRKFWRELRVVNDQPFNDPSFLDPSQDVIAKDRAVRKMQVTDGLSVINRLFAQFSTLLCSQSCEPDKLVIFKRGLRKILAMTASVSFHRMKDGIDFTPIAMLNISIHIIRFMRVSISLFLELAFYKFLLFFSLIHVYLII
jgi:hypothetical protein